MKTKKTKEEFLNEIREGVVYIYTNKINNKKYVGQTLNPKHTGKKSRYYAHNNAWWRNRKQSDGTIKKLSLIDQSIYKYGIENFDYEEIFYIKDKLSIVKKELDKKEIYYIDFYQTQNRQFGYNIMPGGNSIRFPQENKGLQIAMVQCDLDGNILNEFESVQKCKQALNLSNYMLYCRINGKHQNDYILKYKEGEKLTPEEYRSYKKIKQYDLDGNLIRVFNSFKEAVNEGYNYKRIHRCIKGELYSYKDCFWKYDNDEENVKLSQEELQQIKEQQRRIEMHENMIDANRKIAERKYTKPPICYYLNGEFVKEFQYRWEVIEFFKGILSMTSIDHRLKHKHQGHYRKTPYQEHPEIELCYKGDEKYLKFS